MNRSMPNNDSLSKMTNQALWALFPIVLINHQPFWKTRYQSEKEALEKSIGSPSIFRVHHIGSTAVPNLIAKPTIDILLEIQPAKKRNLFSYTRRLPENNTVFAMRPKICPAKKEFASKKPLLCLTTNLRLTSQRSTESSWIRPCFLGHRRA